MVYSTQREFIARADECHLELWSIRLYRLYWTHKLDYSIDGLAIADIPLMIAIIDIRFLIRIWDVENRTLSFEIKGINSIPYSLIFSYDNKQLFCWHLLDQIKVWDIDEGIDVPCNPENFNWYSNLEIEKLHSRY